MGIWFAVEHCHTAVSLRQPLILFCIENHDMICLQHRRILVSPSVVVFGLGLLSGHHFPFVRTDPLIGPVADIVSCPLHYPVLIAVIVLHHCAGIILEFRP